MPNDDSTRTDQPDSSRGTVAKRSDSRRRPRHWVRWLVLLLIVAGLIVAAPFLAPWIERMFNTISTDDAYLNGHVTFVAARVSGQVSRVLVDDNYRVKRGDLLVELDKEPYLVQVSIQKAAVAVAEANLIAAKAQVRGQVAQTRASLFALQHAMEDVKSQIANLHASLATLNSRRASLRLAEDNLVRNQAVAPSGAVTEQELQTYRETVRVDEAAVNQTLETIYAQRVALGLPAQPPQGRELTYVPENLAESFSAVRQALGQMLQNASQFGYSPLVWPSTPQQAMQELEKLYSSADVARTIAAAPAVKQAEARLRQARRNLEEAELNLRYCDIVSEIDGVVTRRNVNPGNNVQAAQSLMAIRSLREIWIDANFTETQLADLRIGQRVLCEVDMYGSRREFEGRITGFTMGTGQTLALLPPQNATGNFVKIVQRLPVRIELTNYNPNKQPLFVGLSVVPYVYYKEPPTGPHAGDVLQPYAPLPKANPEPKP